MTTLRLAKKPELFIPVLGILSLLTACFIICAKKYFFDDEFITFYLVTDPSITHMLRALADQVDVSPPLYYILAWLWAKGFGASELSLRFFSSLVMGLAFAITWKVVRRCFGFWSASFGVTASFFLSLPIFEHNAEARFYGLFMALGALAFLQYDRIIRKSLTYSWKDFFANAGIHGSLVLTHNFGPLYSGIFLLAYILASIYQKVFAPRVYLSVILGWAAFLPWLGSFLRQAEVGKPHSWIPVPGYQDLLFSFSHGILISIFLIMLFLISYLIAQKAEYPEESAVKGKIDSVSLVPLMFLGVLLIVLPPIPVWIISQLFISIFADKYMILSTLGWSILLSWLAWTTLPSAGEPIPGEIWRSLFLSNGRKKLLSLAICLLLLFPSSLSLMKKTQARPGAEEEQLCGELPIVVEGWDDYLARHLYSPAKNRYCFILDLEAALDRYSNLNAVDSYHTMAAIRRHYPFFNIVQGSEFLKTYDRFLVLKHERQQWFELRIKNNLDFNFIFLKNDLILVERKK